MIFTTLVLIFVLFFSVTKCSYLPIVEWTSLKIFFISTNGENWDWKNETIYGSKWNFTTGNNTCSNVCLWQGITCVYNDLTLYNSSLNSCSIENLYLKRYNLCGSLPSEIENFANLTEFDIRYNRIAGSLPREIGNLENLRILNIGNNLFNNTLPYSIGSLKKVEYLFLANNYFSGNLPTSIGELKSMTNFYIYNNAFDGPIPE